MIDQAEGHSALAPRTSAITAAVGDRIRFSTALLRQIHDGPDHESELVEVERIIREPDGDLTLWVKRVETTPPTNAVDPHAQLPGKRITREEWLRQHQDDV